MVLAFVTRFDLRDDKGKTSFTKIRIPTTLNMGQISQFAQAMAQLIADFSTCEITGASITLAIDLSALGLKVSAQPLSDVAEKAAFIFNTAVTGFKARLRLPTFREFLVPSGSDAVDLADPDVAAFAAAMENGIVTVGGTISPTDDRLNDVVSVSTAREVKRRTLT